MEGHDHIRLGIFLNNEYLSNINIFHRFLFCAGNFAPDRWAPTYFKGFFKEHKLNGHKFENCRKRIVKTIPKLGNKAKWGALSFFRVGMICHFVADSFTFPHNEAFEGGIKEHVEYEKLLTAELKKYIAEQKANPTRHEGLFVKDYMKAFDRIHEEYLKQTPSVQNDRICILYMNRLLLDHLLNQGIVLKFSKKYKKALKAAA